MGSQGVRPGGEQGTSTDGVRAQPAGRAAEQRVIPGLLDIPCLRSLGSAPEHDDEDIAKLPEARLAKSQNQTASGLRITQPI